MLCLALVMGVGMCAAQKAADKKTVTTVFTTDIDCEHCVKKIMNNVPSLGKGVKDVKVDLPKKEVTVVYDSTKYRQGFCFDQSQGRTEKSRHEEITPAGFVIEKGGHHCPPFCFGCWAGSCTAVGFPRSAIHCPLSAVCCLPYDSGRQPIRAGACRTTAGSVPQARNPPGCRCARFIGAGARLFSWHCACACAGRGRALRGRGTLRR